MLNENALREKSIAAIFLEYVAAESRYKAAYEERAGLRSTGQRMAQHHPSRIRRVHELFIRSLRPPYQDGILWTPGSPRLLPMMVSISFLVSRYPAMLPQFQNLLV